MNITWMEITFIQKIVDFDNLLVEKEHLVRKQHTRPEVTS
jgi:hypothetical protein